MRRLATVFIASILGVSALFALTPRQAYAAIDQTPDCDTVAIIRCGVFDEARIREKASQADIPRVFAAFGIQMNELENGFVNGVVWRDGRVTVGTDQVVARNAQTAGRWDNPKAGMTKIPNTDRAYKMSTSHFVDDGQVAFMKMVDGKFRFAVIKTCGNPVTATPVEQPKPNLVVTKDVTKLDGNNWTQTVTVRPGDHVRYRVIVKNTSKVTVKNVRFNEQLPAGITQVMGQGKTTLNDRFITNDLRDGMNMGDLKPGEQFVLSYEAQTRGDERRQTACQPGLTNTVIIKSEGLPDKSDTANVRVCAPASSPEYACNYMNLRRVGDVSERRVQTEIAHTARAGATFKHYLIDFGDGTAVVQSSDGLEEHRYVREGTYRVKASVVVAVNNQERTVSSDTCEKTVNFGAPTTPVTPDEPKVLAAKSGPEKLVDTGAGAVAGVVISTITGSALAYRYIWLRRFM